MKVCIDAGHGGRDRWNRGKNGYVEADGCLDIALQVGEILVRHGIEVVYTRTKDTNLAWEGEKWRDLRSRAVLANKHKADLFVSIHTNAGTSISSGTETYCLKRGGEAEKLAKHIQTCLVTELGTRNRGVKESNYAVLRLTDMPAVLTEVAFHSNPEEEALLLNKLFRADAAIAIAKGVLLYTGKSYAPYVKEDKREWQQIAGEQAIDALAAKGIIANPELWKEQDLVNEPTPLWLFFTLFNRLGGSQDEKI